MDDEAPAPGDVQNEPREIDDADLLGIAEVHRLVDLRAHEPDDPVDEVGHITEAPSLHAVAMNPERFAAKGLGEECRDDATVVRAVAGPVGC